MVENIAELQDRIMDFAHRHPLEMLQGNVTVLREQMDELRKQAAARARADNDLSHLREVVQRVANRFTGIEQLVGNLETRVANYEGQIDEHTHVHGLQKNEINGLKTELATLKAPLINAGLIKTNMHTDIRKWIDKFNEPQACQVDQATQASIKVTPQPVISRVRTPPSRTSEAEGPALVSAFGRANINNPAAMANAHNKNNEHSNAVPPQLSTTTPSIRAGLNPEAPSFRSKITSSPVLNLRGGDSATKDMAKQTYGLESSIWAPGNAIGPHVLQHAAHQPEHLAPAQQPVKSGASSPPHGNVAADDDWSAGLRQSMWAPRAREADRHEARQPKISRAVPILDPHGKPVSGAVISGRQGTDIVDSTGGAPISLASGPFARHSSTPQESGHRAHQATGDDSDTISSAATVQGSNTAVGNSANTMVTDNTARFLAKFRRLIQQCGFTITQAADMVYREAYGNVDVLGEAGGGGPSTTHNSQLASTFAGLVLLDDHAHLERVKPPVVPIGVKKEPKPLSLKTELEGALRFNGQLDKETSTNVGEGDNGKEATGEIKSMNIEGSTSSGLAGATTDASQTDNVSTNTSWPTIMVSTGPGPVMVDGDVSVTFHNVKYKVKANGNYGNKPTYMVGHLHRAAYDHLNISLTFTIARGTPPTIAITATTADETVITITFILPVYVQSLAFIKRIANDPAVFAEGSEPMNELSALANPETGVIPGHLRKIHFTYNTCNLDSALVVHKREADLQAMEASKANMYRFFATITHWEGGAIEALFTDEEHDAGVVDKVLDAFEALYASK